ncbi:MAG: transcription termination/antitermination protein NusG [Propionibacteriaceae bacterium]|jgi:transcriptional antiterminator NusG|nr:transcription termination/antitermination protein NusG [Propionibacteriaceae bacterium]
MVDADLNIDDTELNLDLDGPDTPASVDAGINLFLDDVEDASTPETEINLDFGSDDEDQADESATISADDADALREQIRKDLEFKPGDWYVVHTYSGMEKRVKQNIDSRVKTLNMEDFIYETIVPTEDVVEIRNGVKKTVTRTVLPGYVLVRMDLTDDSWSAVRHTPSVTGFVGRAQDPVPLSLSEVIEMLLPSVMALQQVKDGVPARKKKVELVDFQIGDSVMLTDGPFTGVHATITEINPHTSRLKATLEFMGRDTPVDLTLDQVQKI